jgi:hypothetical protein
LSVVRDSTTVAAAAVTNGSDDLSDTGTERPTTVSEVLAEHPVTEILAERPRRERHDDGDCTNQNAAVEPAPNGAAPNAFPDDDPPPPAPDVPRNLDGIRQARAALDDARQARTCPDPIELRSATTTAPIRPACSPTGTEPMSAPRKDHAPMDPSKLSRRSPRDWPAIGRSEHDDDHDDDPPAA